MILRCRILPLLFAFALAACGGSSDSAPAAPSSPSAGPSPSPSPSPGGGSAQADCGLPDFRNEALRAINAARAVARSCGGSPAPAVRALAWNDALAQAAAAHSQDMARNDYFAHQGLDGRNVADRVTAAGYAWSTVGENIALGQPGIADVMQSWLASPGHCSNLMNAAFRDVALACARNAQGRPLWTLNLAAPR